MRLASFIFVTAMGWLCFSCAKPEQSIQCATGIFCPAGTQCGAVQPVCLTTNCGNGRLDPGEQCDHGDIIDGDSCSSTCQNETCGNGTPDPGEDCDPPGSITGGLVCSPTCKFEVCGNGVMDLETSPPEECDEGTANTETPCATPAYSNPPMTCSTCTTGCQIATVVGPYCGDAFCDNGETITSCPADCSGCGNGQPDPGEQCDNGAANTNTPCTAPGYANPPDTCSTCTRNCTIATVLGPFCGDGTCSDGETQTTCPADCTGCGNGLLEGTEQCDDGAANTATPCATPPYANPPIACSTCSTSCTIDLVVGPYCGDGTCANGETKATCAADCAGCGNGVLEAGEQCDDGGANTDTPCATPAYANPPMTCSTCTQSCTRDIVVGPYCGDGTCANGESLATCPADCSGCGNGLLDSGEQCDDGGGNTDTPCATPAYHNPPRTCSTCTSSCMLATVVGPYCGDGTCQGAAGETKSSCPVDCSGCGNGLPDPGEQCDEGAGNTDTPCGTPMYANPPTTCSRCTTACMLDTVVGPYCGDGTCDATDGETLVTCPADCTGCGNGILEGTEQCDSGAANTDTPCTVTTYSNPPATCTTCTESCQLDTVVGPYCGDGVKNGTEDCDGSDGTECPTMGDHGATCGNDCVLDTTQCM